MIIPGRLSVASKVVTHLRCPKTQAQPCGVDLTLKKVLSWTSPGRIDFDNRYRKTAETREIPFVYGEHAAGEVATVEGAPTTKAPLASTPPPQHQTRQCRHTTSTSGGAGGFGAEGWLRLGAGSYLVEFNEEVDVPLDRMGQIFVRSSLFRSGALLSAGVMDSGYRGAVGAVLQVLNEHGIVLQRHARLAQMVFHLMTEKVEGYSGVISDRGVVDCPGSWTSAGGGGGGSRGREGGLARGVRQWKRGRTS